MSHTRSRLAAVLVILVAFACATAIVAPSRTHAQASDDSCAAGGAARSAEASSAIAAYYAMEAAYNNFAETAARAGSAPTGYVWASASPNINQSPGVRDSLNGQEILRADLYYAHDLASQARQACRDRNCGSFQLPASHASAQGALSAYFAAYEAMPLFAGPSGMRLQGIPLRTMGMPDAHALEQQGGGTYCSDTPQTGTEGARLNSDIAPANANKPASNAGAQCSAPTRTLSRGTRSIDVTKLQKFLVSSGFMTEEMATGFFGKITEAAVQKFQAKNKIVSSGDAESTGYGTVGKRTLNAMRTQCGEATTPAAQNTPVANSETSEPRSPSSVYDEWYNNAIQDSVIATQSDVCSNIPAVQTVVPVGYHAEGDQCVSNSNVPSIAVGWECAANSDACVPPPPMDEGCSDASKCAPPAASQSGKLGAAPYSGGYPLTVKFYNWTNTAQSITFGDQTTGTIPACVIASGNCISGGLLSHTYTSAGTYQASMGGTGNSALGSYTITVNNQPYAAPTVAAYVSGKPSLAQFLKAANTTNTARASSLLYGVIGSVKDMRDWKAIMASSDPLQAACQATNEMYNSGNSAAYMPAGAVRVADFDPAKITVLAQTTNFVFYKEEIPGAGVHYGLHLTDSNGYLLAAPANPDILVQHLSNHCFETSQLTSLQAQLDAKSFNLTGITSWPNGFIGWGKSPQDPTITGSTLSSVNKNAQLASALTAVENAINAIVRALK